MEFFWSANIRNHSFFKRLPLRFNIKILDYVRTTKRGNWYYCKINKHFLNVLSQIELEKEKLYLVEKVSPLEIRVIQTIDNKDTMQNKNDNTVSFLA